MDKKTDLEERVYSSRFKCAIAEYREANREYKRKWTEWTKSESIPDRIIGYFLTAGNPLFSIIEAPVAIPLIMLSSEYSEEKKGYYF